MNQLQHDDVHSAKNEELVAYTVKTLNDVFKDKYVFEGVETGDDRGYSIKLIKQPGTKYSMALMARIHLIIKTCSYMYHHMKCAGK